MKSAACIVITIHSSNPSANERISFQQCFKIFHQHDIFIVAPKGLDLSAYKQIVSQFNVKFIDSKWLSSKYEYNQLKLSKFFYDLFEGYKFLLTYELDCFAFRDDLLYWCEKNYDYIGAPWFDGLHEPGNKIIGVGNSGFSLRKISSTIKVLRQVFLDNDDVPRQQHPIHRAIKYVWLKFMNSFGKNYSIWRLGVRGEDLFFCRVVPRTNPDFQIAPIEEALAFAFEARPELLFEINSRQLPMGCHAWQRYNPNFWKPFIESFGYKL